LVRRLKRRHQDQLDNFEERCYTALRGTEVLRWRRAKELHQRVQGQTENVDDYITAVRKLTRSTNSLPVDRLLKKLPKAEEDRYTVDENNVNTLRSLSPEPQSQTRQPHHRVADDAKNAHQHTGRLHSSTGCSTLGPITNCMSITSLTICFYCKCEHQYGTQICKTTNVLYYCCNRAGHFESMCRTRMRQNKDKGPFLRDRPKQNWQSEFNSKFISGRVSSGHLDNSPGSRNI